ncbi:hypothetical protein Syun_012503 [Stephania yunnanensis]|uniref:CBF1-interacting co-repressor CIR N-terminal domain-containing protein n=1 Tax=Stephania yunnanensis TaxID=152371 RepID=A0AAP0K0X9_9MAGN
MGGHGGLNILPQKRWNVYNFDNREKVRKDEKAAAEEEQLKREQSRKRDSEFRLEKLRQAKGLADRSANSSQPISKSGHIDLFQGLKDFDESEDLQKKKNKKRKKEEPPRVVTAEDEKYRLGYGVAGKGVKAPWYLSSKSSFGESGGDGEEDGAELGGRREGSGKSGKKSLEELREERMKREKRERERERELVLGRSSSRRDARSVWRFN